MTESTVAEMTNAGKLTEKQSIVMEALSEAGGPLTAYAILDQLRDRGFNAPPQVYRALDKLLEFGLVHRLESLNAFVACRQPDCESHPVTAFMICNKCRAVTEISDESVAKRLRALARSAHFVASKTTVELHGTCGECVR